MAKAECLCSEIHPADRPCIVCDARVALGIGQPFCICATCHRRVKARYNLSPVLHQPFSRLPGAQGRRRAGDAPIAFCEGSALPALEVER